MKPAPIILFCYNRPELLRVTLESLRDNTLAAESILHVYCDGPRPSAGREETESIGAVRALVRSENWCGTVVVHERGSNLGLSASVIGGVSEVLADSDRVIVIEDDVLLSPFFLWFMNEALEKHRHEERVISVGAWNYFHKSARAGGDYFYFRYPDSIAWATFARSWRLFESDGRTLLGKLRSRALMQRLNGDGHAAYFEKMLVDQVEGRVDSWAIRWTGTAVLHGKLSVFPSVALAKHLGFGGSATHEKSSEDYNRHLRLSEKPLSLAGNLPLVESPEALADWKKFVQEHFMERPGARLNRLRLIAYRTIRKMKAAFFGEDLTPADRLLREARKTPRFTQCEIGFLQYRLKVGDFLSVAQQIKEYFEDERIKFAGGNDRPLILDCGSNVGVSVLYFKNLFPRARITAFEADPGTYELLTSNLTQNGVSDVEVLNKAVWVHDSGVRFSADGADGGRVTGSEHADKVPSVDFRQILVAHEEIDLLKMDIEGAETEVLLHAGEELKRARRIFVEYHSFAAAPQRLHELLELFGRIGFRYYIGTIGSQSSRPFMGINAYNGMDMQLEIHAIRHDT